MPDRLAPADLDWTDAGPVSRRFSDVYFSAEGGLEETRAVFLAGCGLPDAWADRDRFVLAETGFGTGLNILAALDLWRRTSRPGARLHVFSVEAHPLTRTDAARAHAAWPNLSELSEALLAQWPAATPGFHRIDLPDWNATIDLGHGEAGEMLRSWDGRADAWFLDGFAPAANPQMWRDEVLALVAARSAPGARLASFTVAGAVRRGLAAAGFRVEKKPGHGRKRERLEATLPGAPAIPGRPNVLVIGAGIAGASLARAFNSLGVQVRLVEAVGEGAGASGAPAALVTPRLDAGSEAVAQLGAQAFTHATRVYRRLAPEAVLAQGVLRLARDARDAGRLDRIAVQPLWPEGALEVLDLHACSARLGEPTDRPGLWMAEAVVVEPPRLLSDWLAGVEIVRGRATSVTEGAPAQAHLDDGRVLSADAIVVAAGWGAASLVAAGLRPVRGQLSSAEGAPTTTPCVWGAGYAVPTRDGVLVGATHDRGRTDIDVEPADEAKCLQALATVRPRLAESMAGRQLSARASVRATTADHLPLCGEIGRGVWMLGGLGGRGFAWSPLLADHLAARIVDAPSPLPAPLAALLNPMRGSASGG